MKKNTMGALHGLGLLAMLGLVACGSGTAPSASEETFHLTVVHVDAQGHPAITSERLITAGEQRAMNEERAGQASSEHAGVGVTRQATTVDPSCAPSDLWIYDGYNGTGDMMCLAGEGTIWLQNLLSTCSGGSGTCSWFMRIRSYWPGTDDGWIGYEVSDWSPAYSCVTYFPPWAPLTNADACVQRSDELGTAAPPH